MCKVLTLRTVEQSMLHIESLLGAASSPTKASTRVKTYQYQSIVNTITYCCTQCICTTIHMCKWVQKCKFTCLTRMWLTSSGQSTTSYSPYIRAKYHLQIKILPKRENYCNQYKMIIISSPYKTNRRSSTSSLKRDKQIIKEKNK